MRIVRIREVPAIEQALARFDTWWSGLSGRERVLLSVLAILLALVIAVFVFIKPIQSARAEATADIRTYETLNARIVAAGSLTTGQTRQRTGSPASIVTGAARSAGLTATTRPQAGGVRAVVDTGAYDDVLDWLADVTRSSSLSVRRVRIVRGDSPGRVSATVDFAP